ncbi:hypothetical protein ACFE04_006287 [Oxalis oulophora]
MKRKQLTILKLLFAINSLSLYLYFTTTRHHEINHTTHIPTSNHISKPWPILPSHLPWTPPLPPSTVAVNSCEAFFGNGYTRRIDLLPRTDGGGWFRCFYSETLRSSICEGGRIKMNVDKIIMSRGGERLDNVIGRKEEEELPVFKDGAFEIHANNNNNKENNLKLVSPEFLNQFVPINNISRHTMRELFSSIRVRKDFDNHCDQWIEEPTLLVTRFEYANLFHTVTDWYSAYVSSRVTGLPNRPRLVFVDGHCRAPLEETWKALYSGLRYAKSFNGSVCFRHAIFSPLGYETGLFEALDLDLDCWGSPAHELLENPNDKKTARLSEFGEMFKASFGFPTNENNKHPTSVHNVLFVRRENYLAHPRHGGKVESRLSNEQEVFDALQNWAWSYQGCKINLVNGLFAHMPMRDQVRAIQDASVIVGAHGAGMTHIVSAMPKTIIFEIISSEFMRPHFRLIAQWKGLEYHAIYLVKSYAYPSDVVKKLNKIVRRLGC